MFREKLHKNPNERGYLYIRESVYKRDKRSLKRSKNKDSNLAFKQRGKYSKKKDIYCGKIYEVELQKVINFKDYLKNKENIIKYYDYLEKLDYDILIDKFVKYLLFIYNVDKKDFYSSKKKVYTFAEGFSSKDIIDWLKRFNLQSSYYNHSEMKRFYNRCQDCAIFDEEVINILYLKLVPDVDRDEIRKEIEDLQKIKLKKKSFKNLMGFMKKNVN